MKRGFLLGVAALTVCITGCGTTQTHQAASIKTIQTTLPKSVETSLSAPKARMRKVNTLPITHGVKDAANVLYIAPDEVYAINQFRSVWSQLKVKPDVVWTNTDSSSTVKIWAKEGYKKDPLPGLQTFYSTSAPPTPDAYHKVGNDVWDDEPGIMPNSDVSYWVKFFS